MTENVCKRTWPRPRPWPARIEALISDGVHRIGDHEGPFSLHVLGIGVAELTPVCGAAVVGDTVTVVSFVKSDGPSGVTNFGPRS